MTRSAIRSPEGTCTDEGVLAQRAMPDYDAMGETKAIAVTTRARPNPRSATTQTQALTPKRKWLAEAPRTRRHQRIGVNRHGVLLLFLNFAPQNKKNNTKKHRMYHTLACNGKHANPSPRLVGG